MLSNMTRAQASKLLLALAWTQGLNAMRLNEPVQTVASDSTPVIGWSPNPTTPPSINWVHNGSGSDLRKRDDVTDLCGYYDADIGKPQQSLLDKELLVPSEETG
jgi:hypothetical protein